MRRSFGWGAALAASLTFSAAGFCPSDVDGNGSVGVTDLLEVLADWGCMGSCAGDINGDNVTDVVDMLQVLADWGCVTSSGPKTTLHGTVTNELTGAPIANASVTVSDVTLFTDEFGEYDGGFPVGLHEIVIEAEHFNTYQDEIVLFPDIAAFYDAELTPVAPVVVEIVTSGDDGPGEMAEAMAQVFVLDGSSILQYDWMQTAGAPVGLTGGDTDTVMIDLASRADYKAMLIDVLSEPPIGPEQLPENVPLPPGEFPGGLQDRFEVVAVDPFALERSGLVGLSVDVTTTSGSYGAEEEIHSHLPWRVATGLRNVPIDAPVLLQGKEQASYDWVMTQKPAASVAVLIDAMTRTPDFTPDAPGLYEFEVTDIAMGGPVTLQVWAGNWRGVIVDQDMDGRPIADSDCTGCHANLGFDNFSKWAQTGHAEIFSDLLDTSAYYNPSCFSCHSVGYDPEAENNGFDDAFDYQDFLAAGLIGNPGDNWTTMLDQFPFAAQTANAQCESCHGPQWGLLGVNSGAHGPVQPDGEPRVSISSTVCATCHGEPSRHGRYQQWQLSAHANYEVAIDEAGSGSCSRCHTANGFLAWLPILLGDQPGDPLDDITVTWTADEVHPQTCVTCHDPHSTGTTSGEPTNATVRISGNTPPLIAGFTAYGVGRGAICMTCHNSRRGLHNDDVFDDYYGTSEATRAPHGSAQTDLLMGENAYLVTVGIRGNHAFLTDTCVSCHMEQTPPPDDLSYNQTGTNHTFYASTEICSQCHTGIDADFIQGGVHDTLEVLKTEIEAALLAYIGEQTALGNIIDLDGDALIEDVADVDSIEFTEYRGRQAMIVTFTDMSVFGPYGMNSIDILDNAMMPLGAFYDFADAGLIKAGWNWTLVHNDGSLGVHNPSFAYISLTAAIEAINPGAASAIEVPSWVEYPVAE